MKKLIMTVAVLIGMTAATMAQEAKTNNVTVTRDGKTFTPTTPTAGR